ncbi:hypothetical protein BC332_21562 [Capsicum chinense]|nr:hypothetical protein BC332_21562 [Capsicum chinense]
MQKLRLNLGIEAIGSRDYTFKGLHKTTSSILEDPNGHIGKDNDGFDQNTPNFYAPLPPSRNSSSVPSACWRGDLVVALYIEVLTAWCADCLDLPYWCDGLHGLLMKKQSSSTRLNCKLEIFAKSYDNESTTSRGVTDSLYDDDSSIASSKNAFGSFSYKGNFSSSPQHFYVKEKPIYTTQLLDVETMKKIFAKLLLGEDVIGRRKGVSTALALSNAITNLAVWQDKPRDNLYRILTVESTFTEEMFRSLNLTSENNALESVPVMTIKILEIQWWLFLALTFDFHHRRFHFVSIYACQWYQHFTIFQLLCQ